MNAPLTPRDLSLALLVILVWGLNFAVIKVGVADMPPLLLGALRYLLAAFPALLFVKPPKVPLRLYLLYGMTMAVAQFALLFTAIHIGMPSGLASLVLQSQSFFTLLLAVVLLAAGISLHLVVRGLLQVPVEGSIPLFMAGAALCLFATTAMGIFLATIARSMPQFGLLMVLILLPLQLLSGGMTPRESMPELVQSVMLLAPTTHFVELGQAILYRGAGLDVVWQPFLALAAIGSALFALSLARFRKTISQMA